MISVICVFFFFSSRRRHTRCLSDWSSDVCSSDLPRENSAIASGRLFARSRLILYLYSWLLYRCQAGNGVLSKFSMKGRGAVEKIGRASCRERGEVGVVGVSLKETSIELMQSGCRV